ncbi:uncharacterized protein ATC70_009748 [Mucor velutinosus]|uniref:Uncharacterized protein n=1 Tax=Mucor velutinosus TaxID=708070 RepID=A0AAN7DLB3_9FUNG|nr:hypothetical protein ATC70_009748 [Mucor velutinosus]
MSKRNRDHVNIWKKVPHRIKGLWKKDRLFDPTSPPPLTIYTKQKPSSSLIYRIFSTRNKNKAILQLKEHQWDHPPSDATELELYASSTEVPIRANILSFFNPSQHHRSRQEQKHGWSNKLSCTDEISRIYMATLQKIRLFSHYAMEQQISIHHMLGYVQSQQQKPMLCRGVYQRDFNSILSGRSMMTDSILMNNRKPKRTRYIFMLLSTPIAHVANKIHPVTHALSRLRRPYAETYAMVQAHEEHEQEQEEKATIQPPLLPVANKMASYLVPADYLLDPATLFCSNMNATTPTAEANSTHRLGTKCNGSTAQAPKATTTSSEHYNLKNIMTKIQIQTN